MSLEARSLPPVPCRLAALSLALLLVCCQGCAGGASPSPPGDPGVAGAAGAAGSVSCAEGGWVSSVQGVVSGEDGSALPGGSAQLCLWLPDERALCLQPTAAGSAGEFAVQVPESLRCVARAALRLASSSAAIPALYCPIRPSSAPALVLPTFTLGEVPPATVLPAEGDADTARTVVFDDGLELAVVPSRLLADDGAYSRLGGRRQPPAGPRPCFLPPSVQLEGLYSFSVEADIDGAFPMRIPNATMLPAGTTVDLFVLGGLSCTLAGGEPLDEGELRRFGQATVSPDGAFIEGGDAATGLPCMTWFGYGVAP
jgi:hypothetical protein